MWLKKMETQKRQNVVMLKELTLLMLRVHWFQLLLLQKVVMNSVIGKTMI